MLRRVTGFLKSGNAGRTRSYSFDFPMAAADDSAFVEAWKKAVPSVDPPKTPLSFMQPRPPYPLSIPAKITVNFLLPYASELPSKEVDMITIPAATGEMGVLPGHISSITELKPGVLSLHEDGEVTKYFISSGFAYIHANSHADIMASEAVPLDRIDASLVQKGLAEFTQKLSSAATDLERGEAEIGIEVYSALNAALTR